jgi:hypothetical protein
MNLIHEGPANVRDPLSVCGCRLHLVTLPIADTKDRLICRDWVDKNTFTRLIDWPYQARYRSGILYSYASIYEPKIHEYAKLENLPRWGRNQSRDAPQEGE